MSSKKASSSPTTSDGSFHATGNNTTLSRRWVYLPMIAYDACNATKPEEPRSSSTSSHLDPQTYMASRKNLPNNVQEKALVEFWHKIGVDYHRNRATVHDPKNNGSKPISLSELDDRIRQRAIMLVGGGINTDWSSSTATVSQPKIAKINGITSASATHPKLQKVRREAKARKRKIFQSAMNVGIIDDKDDRIGQFLFQLNSMWNDYIGRLLQFPQAVKDKSEYKSLCRDVAFWSRVTARITHETAQLVGARVQIKSCQSHSQWKGRTGILIRQTPNTWQLMVPVPNNDATIHHRKKKRKRRTHISDEEKVLDDSMKPKSIGSASITKREGLKTIIVPKRGSELTLLIPVGLIHSKAKVTRDTEDHERDTFVLAVSFQEEA